MAGCRLELLLVLTWTLLLVSVQGWERINETQLRSLYEPGERGEPHDPTDYSSGLDQGEAKILEDVVLEAEGVASSENFDADVDYDDLDIDDSRPTHYGGGVDHGVKVKFEDEPPRSWPGSCNPTASDLEVVCSESGFQITLPTGPLSEVKVFGSGDSLLPIVGAPENCGYEVDPLKNTLTVPFNGCNVERHANGFSLQLLYTDTLGQKRVSTTSCNKFDPDMLPRSGGGPLMCVKLVRDPEALVPPAMIPVPPVPQPGLPQPAFPQPSPTLRQNCGIPVGEQVRCGHYGISISECQAMGCCVNLLASVCYYPLEECTVDQHFVFAIRYNSASIPVDPTRLIVPGNPECKPAIVNNRVAIFKFKVTECGTHSYDVGEVTIYLAEVQSIVHALNLKYGVITRTDPLRFLIECRYNKWGTAQSMASVGYMVKTPPSSMPSSVISNSLYGVELRIAKDETYSSFYDHHHQPLRLLLGRPVYLELRLSSPNADAIILVNYCLAYPRSAKNALVLIYEGCANPHDPHVSILKVSNVPGVNHEKRFIVSAFQFMDQRTNKYLNEEIYFMCSAEVCLPAEKRCDERCFDGRVQ
ncbi:zona pellucida sperm-binding protein 4 [Oreochromis niloticus]|uniref:zona pellucida sperm-binding protein 4 n=1 Tax=Oreochromis niloticus TaxID=8128 RepID=UPI00039466C6|nr:zona pellucida sperm-binding protein 4 [Oreochromis niloticus]